MCFILSDPLLWESALQLGQLIIVLYDYLANSILPKSHSNFVSACRVLLLAKTANQINPSTSWCFVLPHKLKSCPKNSLIPFSWYILNVQKSHKPNLIFTFLFTSILYTVSIVFLCLWIIMTLNLNRLYYFNRHAKTS